MICRRNIVPVACVMSLLVACGQPKHSAEQTLVQKSGNPIFEGWYADPEGIIYDDTYWIYPTWSD